MSHLRTLRRRVVIPALAVLGAAAGMAAPTRADAVIPALGNLNTNDITVDPGGVVEVPVPLVNGVPKWKGTLLDVTMKTAAIWEPVHVRIYLPEKYKTGTGRFSSIYLMHGSGESIDSGRSFSDHGNTPAYVDASPVPSIAVMPEAGKAGWYTDWVRNDLKGHQFKWQTFHMEQLRPWVDAHFRTINDRAYRSIAGFSMGGHGALTYAAQYPQLFSSVASFSGPGNIKDFHVQQVVIANEVTRMQFLPKWGSAIYKSEEADVNARASDVQNVIGAYNSPNWTTKNPWDRWAVYRDWGIKVGLYTGTGATSNLSDIGSVLVESVSKSQNDALKRRFRGHGIDVRYCFGDGDHSWKYWRGDLEDWLGHASGNTPAACPNNWGAPRP